MAIQEFKCPNCGAALKFDADLQELSCPYCDSVVSVEALKAASDEAASAAAAAEASVAAGGSGSGGASADEASDWGYAGADWNAGEQDGLVVYSCRSCGGEIVGDETLGATACPFCGNPIVVTSKFSGALRPDAVVPFKVGKERAVEALKKHYLGKRLLPKAFKDENHIEEVKGVYVPFWLFDANADARMDYSATRSRMWSDSRYNYRETSYYRVRREGDIGFDGVPVDGSKAMSDVLMESVEPFDMTDAVGFNTAYLSGFFANKYDVEADECFSRADERIKNSAKEAFAATVTGYDTVTNTGSSIKLTNGSTKYALLPVWLLCTRWEDKPFLFAMNGQTGRFVGDLPMDKSLFRSWFLRILGIAFAILVLLSILILALAPRAFADSSAVGGAVAFVGDVYSGDAVALADDVYAGGAYADAAYAGDDGVTRFTDETGLLDAQEAESLEAELDRISAALEYDVVVAVVYEFDQSKTQRLNAADYFEDRGYGLGADRSGSILLLAPDDRDFGYTSFGFGETAFNVDNLAYFEELFLPDLRESNYFDAFMAFAAGVEDYVIQAESGEPYGRNNAPIAPGERLKRYLAAGGISLAIAALVALCVTLVWKSQLKSVRGKDQANAYVREGSLRLRTKSDMFLYRNVSKSPRQTESGGGSGGGGSRGSFTGSSGRGSIGGGGKY